MVDLALAFARQLSLQAHNAFENTFKQIQFWTSATRSHIPDIRKPMNITAFHLGQVYRELMALVIKFDLPQNVSLQKRPGCHQGGSLTFEQAAFEIASAQPYANSFLSFILRQRLQYG